MGDRGEGANAPQDRARIVIRVLHKRPIIVFDLGEIQNGNIQVHT